MSNEYLGNGKDGIVACTRWKCRGLEGCVGEPREVDYYTLDNDICSTTIWCEKMIKAMRSKGHVVQ